MSSKTFSSRLRLRSKGLRAWLARKDAANFYGLFAVLVVASVQTFFSLQRGGYFPEQWYWGVAAVTVALLGAALVPGYLSSPSVGRGQWALAGALILLMAVVAASILWSISPSLSVLEASRTAMYVGVFVLLLPAAARWGSLIVDATLFGALLPQAIYGLLQKIIPMSMEFTGWSVAYREVVRDPKVYSLVGYHPTFGMMCAMGALLVIARVGSFRSYRLAPLRAFYSAAGVLFLVALYFSFSRGALLALVVGTVVLLALAENRFEVLGNMAVVALPALWVVWRAQEYPALVGTLPYLNDGAAGTQATAEAKVEAGLWLTGPLLEGVLLVLAAQVLFAVLVRASVGIVPEGTRGVLRTVGLVAATGVVAGGLFLGWNAFQQAGGYDGLVSRITNSEQSSVTDQTTRFGSISVDSRAEQWAFAWENWREHPLTGTGGATYQFVHEEKAFEKHGELAYYLILYPDSVWLSLLSDTGVFAFLAFAAFCVGCLVLACYNAFFSGTRSRALIAGSAAAATAYLALSSISFEWYIPASTMPFFALAAVAVVASRRRQPERSTDLFATATRNSA